MTTRVLVSPLGYNTNLVKPEDAPKSFADLLDPKWTGKMVKAHPAYSGTIMNATFQIARELGWEYFEKLAKQRVLQVQSSTDPPKKLALGERAVMADGNGSIWSSAQGGRPAGRDRLSRRGHAARHRPERGVQGGAQSERRAPVPELAALARGQQLLVDCARQHSPHRQTVEKPGARKLSDIKLMKEDAAGVEKASEEIKARYAQIFKV